MFNVAVFLCLSCFLFLLQISLLPLRLADSFDCPTLSVCLFPHRFGEPKGQKDGLQFRVISVRIEIICYFSPFQLQGFSCVLSLVLESLYISIHAFLAVGKAFFESDNQCINKNITYLGALGYLPWHHYGLCLIVLQLRKVITCPKQHSVLVPAKRRSRLIFLVETQKGQQSLYHGIVP